MLLQARVTAVQADYSSQTAPKSGFMGTGVAVMPKLVLKGIVMTRRYGPVQDMDLGRGHCGPEEVCFPRAHYYGRC